jgi:hypothetical protein
MATASLKSDKTRGPVHAEHHSRLSTVASKDEVTIQWVMGEPYQAALQASKNDERLTSTEFMKKADSWSPDVRIAYFWTVAHTERYDRLLDDKVIDTMPRLAKWDYESTALYLESMAESGTAFIRRMIDPVFLEKVGKWRKELKKAYFGAMEKSNLWNVFTSAELVDEISNATSFGAGIVYIWHIGATGKFIPFSEWARNGKIQ